MRPCTPPGSCSVARFRKSYFVHMSCYWQWTDCLCRELREKSKCSPKGQKIGCRFSSNRTKGPFSKHCLNFSEFTVDGAQNVTSQVDYLQQRKTSTESTRSSISMWALRRWRQLRQRQHAIPQPTLLDAGLAVRVGEAAAGAGLEGAGEEQLHQEAAHIEAQVGGEASESRGGTSGQSGWRDR
ncbi:hypothetical protein TRIUR3_01896 [Triticum urartu]|uniref:Uncharacterized protein n=1 Tax=Triticum urartu TaxID=4572 RepID=M8AYU8_TRIUA|nr:hypothetical protein TRIUR3_01896 [Triticum urartu]